MRKHLVLDVKCDEVICDEVIKKPTYSQELAGIRRNAELVVIHRLRPGLC